MASKLALPILLIFLSSTCAHARGGFGDPQKLQQCMMECHSEPATIRTISECERGCTSEYSGGFSTSRGGGGSLAGPFQKQQQLQQEKCMQICESESESPGQEWQCDTQCIQQQQMQQGGGGWVDVLDVLED